MMRRLHNAKRIQNMRYGYDLSVNDKGGVNAIVKHVAVMDMKHFYAKSLTAYYRNLVNDISGDESDLWPNSLEKMFIINAPWSFRAAWSMVKIFLHPVTAAKVAILGSHYTKELLKKIPADQIPKKYGGTGTLPIHYGYSADIEPELLDGDYSSQGDPINLDTIPCVKNNAKLLKRRNSVDIGIQSDPESMEDHSIHREKFERLATELDQMSKECDAECPPDYQPKEETKGSEQKTVESEKPEEAAAEDVNHN